MPPPVPLSGSLHEAPTELLYGVQPPAYEPPPRSSDRLADGPVGGPGAGPGMASAGGPGMGPAGGPGIGASGGPGISAGYRAVSQAGDATRPPGARWPAPSPAPPAQAHHGPQGAEHTYAPPQEPPLYASPLHTTSPYGTPAYGTADATSSFDSAPTGSIPMAGPPAPSYETAYEASYETPYRAAPAPEPFDTAVPTPAVPITPTPGTGAEPSAGPFSAPPAGEPWHAPAGDRP
ncbi:hypothetical protein [Streptomyces cyaneofuscatus]